MPGKLELKGKLSQIETVFQRVEEPTLERLNVQPSASALIAELGVIQPEHVITETLTVEVSHAF